jgi:hypothetical protein
MTLVDPVVIPSPPSILAAANRFNGAGGAQPFRNFTTGFVTLETKKGFESVASPAVVLSAAVPEIVRLGQVPAR